MAYEVGKPGRVQRQKPAIKPTVAPAGKPLNEVGQLQRRLGNEGLGQLIGGQPGRESIDRAANESFQAIVNRPIIQPKLRVNQPNDPYEQEADRVANQPQIGRQEQAPAGMVQRLVDDKTLESEIGEIGLNPLKGKKHRELLHGLAEYHALPPLFENGAAQQRLQKLAELKQQALAFQRQQILKAQTKSGPAKETANKKSLAMHEFLLTLVAEQRLGQLLMNYQKQPELKPTLLLALEQWLDQAELPDKDEEAGRMFYLRLKSGDQDLIHNTIGSIPGDQPDYRDDTNNDNPVDRYVITLAVAQKNADWLKNIEMLRNTVIQKAITSPHQMLKKAQAGQFEEYASEAVLKKQPDWSEKNEAQQNELLEQFTHGIHQVGHTWLRLSAYSGSELKELYSYGFWPQKFYDPESDEFEGGYAGFMTPGPGQVRHPDTEHEQDANKMYYDYPVQQGQFQQVLAMAQERQKNPPPYVLADYNCTKFTRELLNVAGLPFPGKGLLPGHIFTPGKVYQALSKMMNKGDEQVYTKDPLEAVVSGVNQQVEDRADEAQLNARLATNDADFAQPNPKAGRIPQVLYSRTIRYGTRPDQIDQTMEIRKKRRVNFINDQDFINYWQTEREGPTFDIVPFESNGRILYAQQQDYNDSKFGRPRPDAPRKPVTLHKGHQFEWGTQPDKFDRVEELLDDFQVKQIIDPEFETYWADRGGIPIKSGGKISFIKRANFMEALKPKVTVDLSAYPPGRHALNVSKAAQIQGTTDPSGKGKWEDLNVEAGAHSLAFHSQVLQLGYFVFFLNGKGTPYYVRLNELPKVGYNPQAKKEEEIDISAYPIGRHPLNVSKAAQIQGTTDPSGKGGWQELNVEAGEHVLVFNPQVMKVLGCFVFFLNGKGIPYYVRLNELPKVGYNPQAKKEEEIDISAYPIGRHPLNVSKAAQIQGTTDPSGKGEWEDLNVEAGAHSLAFHSQVLQLGYFVFFLNGKGRPYYVRLDELPKVGYNPQAKKEEEIDISAYPIGRHPLNVSKAAQIQGTTDPSGKGEWEDLNVEAGTHSLAFHSQVLQLGYFVFFLNGKGRPYYVRLNELPKVGYNPQAKKEEEIDISAYPIGRHPLNVSKAAQIQGTPDPSGKGEWEDLNVEAGAHSLAFHSQVLQLGYFVFFLNGKGRPYYVRLDDLPKVGYNPQQKEEKEVVAQRSPAGDDLARQSLQNIVNRPIYGAEEAQ